MRRLYLVVVGRNLSETVAHVGVGFDILHLVVVHNAEVSAAEGGSHGYGQLAFGFDYLGTRFLCEGFHFLLAGDCHSPAFFGFRLGDVLVGLSLVDLQGGADVAAYVDVGDVDG